MTTHQTATKRLEDNNYQLSSTTTQDVENYTFIVNSYQPICASLSAADSLAPVIAQRINRSLARQKPSMLRSTCKCHAVTVQEGGRK